MLCLQLSVEGDDLTALHLYARTPYAFTDDSVRLGLLIATQAAIASAGLRKVGHLAQALLNRDVIGQAKGMLMERHRVSSDRAFELISRISQNSNRKLHDVARELVESGTIIAAKGLPPVSPRSGSSAEHQGHLLSDCPPSGSGPEMGCSRVEH